MKTALITALNVASRRLPISLIMGRVTPLVNECTPSATKESRKISYLARASPVDARMACE
jgi:hypothetical protein